LILAAVVRVHDRVSGGQPGVCAAVIASVTRHKQGLCRNAEGESCGVVESCQNPTADSRDRVRNARLSTSANAKVELKTVSTRVGWQVGRSPEVASGFSLVRTDDFPRGTRRCEKITRVGVAATPTCAGTRPSAVPACFHASTPVVCARTLTTSGRQSGTSVGIAFPYSPVPDCRSLCKLRDLGNANSSASGGGVSGEDGGGPTSFRPGGRQRPGGGGVWSPRGFGGVPAPWHARG
jgi:hypothetical protein